MAKTKKAKESTIKKEAVVAPVYEVTFYSDFKSSKNRYAITDFEGNPLWFGIIFDDVYEQSHGELDAAKKAVWLANKVKESCALDSIKLKLFVDAQYLLYQDHPKQKGYVLTELSNYYNVVLEINWIKSSSNKADYYTVCSGYKKWHENELELLAEKIK